MALRSTLPIAPHLLCCAKRNAHQQQLANGLSLVHSQIRNASTGRVYLDAHSVTPHFQVPLTCCDAIRGRWPTVSGTSTRRPRAKLSWRFASCGSPCCSLSTALRRYLRTREVWRGRRRGRGRGEGGDDEGGKGITARESVHKWDTKVSAPLSYNIFEELQTETGIRAP